MTLRILDTGISPARQNSAMTAALAELHRTGRAGDTLRFYRSPPAVLLGQHQNPRRAANLAFCRRRNIEIARRITGGAATLVGPESLGFDLIVERRDFGPSLGNALAWVCTGLAAGISRMGLPAQFEPSGRVTIERGVVARATATYDGLTLIVQGFIQLDATNGKLAEALLVAASEPTTSIAAFLGRVPPPREVVEPLAAGLCDKLRRPFAKGEVSAEERALAARLADEPIEDESALLRAADGAVRFARKRAVSGFVEAQVSLAPGEERQIERVRIAGDFSIAPTHAVQDLENALRGVPADSAAERARELLERSSVTMSGVAPVDIAAVIAAAVRPVRRSGAP